MESQRAATKEEPQISIWGTSTDMAGTKYQRKTYYITLRDGDIETKFSLQVHADNTIIAVPYVVTDYDYDDFDDWGEYTEDYGDE